MLAGMGVLKKSELPPTQAEIDACEAVGGTEGMTPRASSLTSKAVADSEEGTVGWYEPTDCKPRWSRLPALVLCPTRELAVQVAKHMEAVAEGTLLRVGVIVGGLSVVKQERVLQQRPDIIVATPGRLWELYQRGHEYLQDLWQLQFLAVDEADRMVEKGRFQEFASLLAEINVAKPEVGADAAPTSVAEAMKLQETPSTDTEGEDDEEGSDSEPETKKLRKGIDSSAS